MADLLNDTPNNGFVALHPHKLSKEVREQLSQPISTKYLRTVDKGKRGKYTYADKKHLEDRLTLADPDWEEFYTFSGDILVCRLVVCGVSRSATAGMDKPKPAGERGFVERHTQAGKAEAQAFRRACAKFNLGAELWAKELEVERYDDDEDEEDEAPRRSSSRSAPKQSRDSGDGPSDGQRKLLKDLKVPTKVIDGLSAGREGTASALIDRLMAARIKDKEGFYEDPLDFITTALKRIDKDLLQYVKSAPAKKADDDDEDDY